jgi:hypothetical protein
MIVNYVSGDFDCDLDVDSESVQECAEFIAGHTKRRKVDFVGTRFVIPKGLPHSERLEAIKEYLTQITEGG